MSEAARVQSDWHRVGAGLSVRFRFDGDRLDAEWRTRPPTKREWKRVLSAYRRARDAFLCAVGEGIGGVVLCVELSQ